MGRSKKQTGEDALGGRITTRKGLQDVATQMEIAIARRTPKAAHGTGYKQTHNGAIINPRKRKRGNQQRRFTAPQPLTIKRGSEAGKYQVRTGTVNAQTPTLGGTALDAGTPPEITVTADTYVWIKVVGTFGSPDTYVITIETSATGAEPAGADITATGFTSYFFVGWIDYTAGSPATYEINNDYSGGNLGVESFGNANIWYRS